MAYRKRSKYNSVKTKNGDSKKEAKRKAELEMLQSIGKISDLQCQVPFELIPAQFEPNTIGKRGGTVKGKCVERSVKYIADFVYTDENGQKVVEDVKGYKGGAAYSIFTIKRKLMLYIHGIRIKEV